MQSLDQVDIETTTYCNRKCVYCPNYSFGRKSMLMEEKIFLKIVESLNKIGFKGTVCPHLFGEPLSDPRIIKFIELIRYYCPQSSITLYTNGDYLTIEKYRELKSAGINYLVISQHSEKLPDTTKCLIDYVSGYHLAELESISCVNYYSEYYKKDKTDLLNNRGGTVIIPNAGKSSLTCSLVNQLTFDYTGSAILCCNDYNSTVSFGNIKEKNIEKIWKNENYVKSREEIMNGNWIYRICRRCKTEIKNQI